jgi:O-antigen/teichoic acid export membrane protein
MYLANAGYITSSESLAFWLSVYAIVIPFGVFTDILIAYLQATKHIREMARAQAIIRFQSFTLVVMATWLYGMPGFIFATICAYIVGLIPLLWQVKLNFFKYSIKAIPNTFYNIAIFSALANSVATLRQYSDIFILDLFTQNRTEIGYYSLATIFVLAASQITSTVQAISTPYLSERASDLVWFRSKVFDTQLRMSLLSMAVGVGIYILCWLLVHFFYGITYQSTITYASILIIRYIIWSSCAVIGPALFALEMVRYNFVSAVISTLFGIFFSYHWLQQFGIIGVAWAQVIAAIILFILSYGFFFLVLRRLATY